MTTDSRTPRITVVGLGPGGAEHVTVETLAVLDRIPHRFLRTSRHPTASAVADATTFDHLYESADTFGDVYARTTDALVEAAHTFGEIVYAVPGSPLVLERSVADLRRRTEVDVDVRPAMSFLDVAYSRLGIDPVEAGVRLVDGHDFAVAAAGDRGPLLVAHTHANWVLSDIKLAVENATGDEPVIILQALGTPDEVIVETTWAELDRTIEADHLTSIWIPQLAHPVGAEYVRFHQLARTLREQCPWDIEQTHDSLVPYLVEETYELVDAITALDPNDASSDEHLIEELGDLLYQIEFHATIAEEQGRFTIADVTAGIHDKLVRRHPHVFGDVELAGESTGTDVTAVDQVLRNWDEIKHTEKQRTSIFDGIPRSLPSLAYADKVGTKASKVGFDWPDVDGAFAKIAEETTELNDALADPLARTEELGDLLFAVVNVARHLDVDPESALRRATDKFRRRFEEVERLAARRSIDLRQIGSTADIGLLDELWLQAKQSEGQAE